jgi:ACS family tartrate transporter-like MFS transporter
LLGTIATQQSLVFVIICLSITGVGLYGYLPSFWTLPTRVLTESAAAVAIGLINSFGNLGGFVGPYLVGYVSQKTGSAVVGMRYLALFAFVAAVLVLSLRRARQAVKQKAQA